MKRLKSVLLTIIVILIGIFIYPNKVNASSIKIGTETINADESKNIYGGNVTLEEVSTSNYILTLNNVNINENYNFGSSTNFGIYFGYGNLTIKLVGKNTISSTYTTGATNYDAIAVKDGGGINNYSLNVIGDGSLTINATNYKNTLGLYAYLVSTGETGKQGPTINLNLKSNVSDSLINAVSNVGNVLGTNINCNLEGNTVYSIYSNINTNVNIANSDINLKVSTTEQAVGIYTYRSNLEIADSEVKILIDAVGEGVSDIGITGENLIKIKDSIIIEDLSGDDNAYGSFQNTTDKGHIEFEHTNGKDFFFAGNGIIQTSKDIVFTNIPDTMIYSGSISFDTVELVGTFDQPNFIDNRYRVITSGLDNKIESGNNQNLIKSSVTSYSFDTNQHRYVVYGAALNDNPLNEEDYTLTKDGKVTLTATGLAKVNALDYGDQKIDIYYYFGDKLTATFKIVDKVETNNDTKTETKTDTKTDTNTNTDNKINTDNKTEKNPKTGDNIITSIILGGISLTSLVISGLYLKKKHN